MLKSLRLQNFRGFVGHAVEFSPFTLLIGQNNAGKTTIIEALRIISVAQSKVATAIFSMAPDEFIEHFSGPVFRFSLKTLDFDEGNIHHNYRYDDPAKITAKFTNNCSISVYLGRDPADRYCQFQLAGGQKINSRSGGTNSKFHKIFVMPPIGSMLISETERDRKYLKEHINSYLSYRHIRNQMYDMPDQFAGFRSLLEDTWDHLQVQGLLAGQGESRGEYHLNLRDGRHPAEVGRVGSGLQAWIQTLWFLSRVDEDSTIVLDEPDVFLHADLQRKLIRILASSNFRQKIVATHSIEMISDVSPDEIVEVRKRENVSRPISTNAEAQAILYQMGTSHHLQLSKLGKVGRVIFLEGKDHQLLGLVARKFGNSYSNRFDSLPRFSIGGMSNWKRVAMTAKVLRDTSGDTLTSILLVDRDYFDDRYLDDIVSQAEKSDLALIYWQRKEIENYFLDAQTIYDHIVKNSQKAVNFSDILAIVEKVAVDLMKRLPAQIGQNFQLADKSLALTTALDRANDFIELRRSKGASDLDLIPGKQAFSVISTECQERYDVSFSATTICRNMSLSRVPEEFLKRLQQICPE